MSVSSVFPLTENGVSITDSKMKADIFATHFKNIGNIGNVHQPLLPKLVLESYCAEGQQLEINKKNTFSELNNSINSLKMTSHGLDLMHNMFFKHMPNGIINDLVKVFNKSGENAEVPDKWKESVVVPILKPNKDDSNQSHTDLLPCFCALGK